LSANLGVTFSYTNFQDGVTKVNGEIASTNLFTFNTVWLDFAYSNISKVLKSVEFLYQMEVGYNDGYYANSTKELWDIVGNSIQANKMYNQFRATMYFDKDISLGVGFILRNFWEHSNSALGALNPAMLDKFDKTKAYEYGKIAEKPDDIKNAEQLKKEYWEGRTDYWNVGWALQFKWKLPLEKLQFPTFFVNLGLGWDPFDDDGSTTCNWYTGNDSAGQSSVYKNNKDYTEETSVFTVGLQWDF
jgi:hypothetical protein